MILGRKKLICNVTVNGSQFLAKLVRGMTAGSMFFNYLGLCGHKIAMFMVTFTKPRRHIPDPPWTLLIRGCTNGCLISQMTSFCLSK